MKVLSPCRATVRFHRRPRQNACSASGKPTLPGARMGKAWIFGGALRLFRVRARPHAERDQKTVVSKPFSPEGISQYASVS